MSKKLLIAALLLVVNVLALHAQRAASATALSFLRDNPARFGLTAADVADVRITDEYLSKHNGVTHVWVQQQYAGLPVYNALFGLHVLSNGTVKHLNHRFVPTVSEKVNSTIPSLSAAKALDIVLASLDFTSPETPRVHEKINERNFIFDKGEVSKQNIPVSACYWVSKDGQKVRLAWTMLIDQANTSDMWNIRVDAQTGEILDRHNHTVYCGLGHAHHEGESCADQTLDKNDAPALPLNSSEAMLNGVYNVFALPAESPAHGTRVALTNPADADASPFGWHDNNGVLGNEFTYTRGNNVWAYDDLANDNTASQAESVDGGANNNFDFPFDPNVEPESNLDAAVVNLFYMNNMMHDITYNYGFDEAAGNFQINNYGKGGQGNDEVRAEAVDAGGTDNANFATPADGSNPRMQMYIWSRSGGNLVKVNGPAAIAGTYYGQTASGWGGAITEVPITADVVVAQTPGSIGSQTQGCEPITNDVAGKIAMIDRGSCEFGRKALNAEEAGAVACIICNFEASTIGMGPGAVGAEVTIPVLMMSSTNCAALRQFAGQGLNITLQQPPIVGPDFLDGDFDNGIIAHEYGHGISNRLTGGPSNAGCLGNEEQMGEGWSDFFSLVTTVKAGDTPTKNRGVGTYVLRESNDGIGIRRYVYSTDMNKSPLTYNAVAQNTGVHAIGEVWNNMLWDLYWAMVDKYGFDANWKNTNSGNGRAIQLVMDGMKLQPCAPGFQDGRDAIILADVINYNGADTCLISQVFARRGLGKNASQGLATSAVDGEENFEPIETCIKELKIKKTTSTPTIEAGTVASFQITVTNHKGEDVTNVTVTENLPQGLTPVAASVSGGVISGNTITWDLGTMSQGQVKTINYSAQSDLSGSVRLYRDEMETSDDWILNAIEGNTQFGLQSTFKVTGQNAWKIINQAVDMDVTLTGAIPMFITGSQPVLRFWNRHWVETGADGGFIESGPTDAGPWSLFSPDKAFRNGYTAPLSYSTTAIPNLFCFTGNSNGWKQSYFDMSHLAGSESYIRFRFGSDATDAFDGWYIDDLELLDLLNYNTPACVTSAQGDQACAEAPERGVIVNPATSSTNDIPNVNRLIVQPNPATDMVYISLAQSLAGKSLLTLTSADGRTVAVRTLNNINGGEAVVLDVNALPAGVYALRVENAGAVMVEKLVIK